MLPHSNWSESFGDFEITVKLRSAVKAMRNDPLTVPLMRESFQIPENHVKEDRDSGSNHDEDEEAHDEDKDDEDAYRRISLTHNVNIRERILHVDDDSNFISLLYTFCAKLYRSDQGVVVQSRSKIPDISYLFPLFRQSISKQEFSIDAMKILHECLFEGLVDSRIAGKALKTESDHWFVLTFLYIVVARLDSTDLKSMTSSECRAIRAKCVVNITTRLPFIRLCD